MREKTMANLEQYRAVLSDLMKQRNELQFKIGEIDSAVTALRRLMPNEEISVPKDNQQALPMVETGRYTGMSTRWGILQLLSEDASGPMSTGQIADALVAGGMTSNARSFAGNVSAVLSGMNHEKGEVTAGNDGWIISDKGKSAWIHIKASRERQHVIEKATSSIVQ
jgi:hypothetical protein